MEISSELQTSDVSLNKAILLYANAGKPCHATIHDVEVVAKGIPEIQPGVNLTLEALEGLVLKLSQSNQLRSWAFVGTDVIASGPTLCAWFTPSQVRHVFFSEDLDLAAGAARLPAMLWVRTSKGELYVYSLASDERPTLETPVFESICFNVWRDGKVCQGTMERTGFEDHEGCMESFWASSFTHRNHVGEWHQTTHPRALHGLWAELLADAGKESFPSKFLRKFALGQRKLKQARTARVFTVEKVLQMINNPGEVDD